LAAHRWLGQTSGLGELLDVDYETLPLISLYRASDVLWKRHAAIEHSQFAKTCDLFNLDTTITLYDLTNTYFEGEVQNNGKAHRGRSKEKRSDCPLVTLGLVVDGSGFVRSSQTFAGNVAEAGTLATMLTGLNAPPGALVVMDAGIASEANIDWLRSHGYRYLVVSRERTRHFNSEQAIDIETATGDTVRGQKVLSEDGQEVRLYCYSQARSQKEEAMAKRFCELFEAALGAIADGLSRPRTEKRITKLWERIGRLKEKSHGIGQHYHLELQADASGKIATALTWTKQATEGSLVTHPGVYCLRSNETAWDAEKLWRTYIMLTDLEAVFRSLKSELGLRPVFHSKEERADGHLFITVLAYQFVQIIRRHLKERGIDLSWNSIRRIMASQCRVTASFRRADGRALHVRKATRAEPEQLAIYRVLNLDSAPGGVYKTIV
jgi:transposase